MESLADDTVLISSLQHYVFCPHQFSIIHVEQHWQDNYLTADGSRLHERVDLRGNHRGRETRVEYALLLISEQYGLSGKADAVEFLSDGTVIPVEYKRGRSKVNDCDKIQLCAQALCLEEMMQIKITEGALFYFSSRERLAVPLDKALREETIRAIQDCKAIISGSIHLSPAIRKPCCHACSLLEYCMPQKDWHSAKAFLQKEMQTCENC